MGLIPAQGLTAGVDPGLVGPDACGGPSGAHPRTRRARRRCHRAPGGHGGVVAGADSCSEISSQKTRAKQRSHRATSCGRGLARVMARHGGERCPKTKGHQVVVALTGEMEDSGAWVRNRLRDDEIRRSGWPNGGGGFQGVSPECFGVGGGAHGRKGSKGEKCGGDRWLIKPQTGREERGRGGSIGGHVVGGVGRGGVPLSRTEEGSSGW
jgi:hypothetical protein